MSHLRLLKVQSTITGILGERKTKEADCKKSTGLDVSLLHYLQTPKMTAIKKSSLQN
jgi:hypothetical protein